jgi:hypothetical protein
MVEGLAAARGAGAVRDVMDCKLRDLNTEAF